MMKKRVSAIILTFEGEKKVNGVLTTEHPASSYGKPVFIDEDGQAYDSWQVLNVVEMGGERSIPRSNSRSKN